MSQFYVQRDDRNFATRFLKQLTDKDDPKQWITVNIPTSKDIDFSVNFDKYQIDDNGVATKGGMDAVTIGDVNSQLATALDAVKSLQGVINQATQAQVAMKQSLDDANKTITAQADTIKQLQGLANNITQQQVALQTQIKALTPAK